jgi:hypothetical protein
MSVIRQPSLFGADASPPEPGDLAGLLAAGGAVTSAARAQASPANAARVSITVDHPWRAAALVGECARRGVPATSVAVPDDHIAVRTVYIARLAALAEEWPLGLPPRGLRLDGRALRLWVLARGRSDGPGTYRLPVGPGDEPGREPIGTALAALGLGPQLVRARGAAHASYRIVGSRRVGRLVELVGEPPGPTPPDIWPR